MAAVRAKTMARMILATSHPLGQPRAATSIEPRAKGMAKMVWEKRRKRRMRGITAWRLVRAVLRVRQKCH